MVNYHRLKTREESKQETRDALLRAGLEAFLEEGVDQPSLDAICARAGFTRGAFYVHFKDRDDFLSAVINKALSEFIDSIIATGTSGEDLHNTIDLFIRVAECGFALASDQEKNPVNIRVLLEASGRIPEISERFSALIQDAITRLVDTVRMGQTANRVRSDIHAISGATMLVAAAIGLIVMVDTGVSVDLNGIRDAVYKLMATSSK